MVSWALRPPGAPTTGAEDDEEADQNDRRAHRTLASMSCWRLSAFSFECLALSLGMPHRPTGPGHSSTGGSTGGP